MNPVARPEHYTRYVYVLGFSSYHMMMHQGLQAVCVCESHLRFFFFVASDIRPGSHGKILFASFDSFCVKFEELAGSVSQVYRARHSQSTQYSLRSTIVHARISTFSLSIMSSSQGMYAEQEHFGC